jgi:hypothetical protein
MAILERKAQSRERRRDRMKTLLTVLLLSTLAFVGCTTSPAPAPGPPKHGYELAKAWDAATARAKTAEADAYYDVYVDGLQGIMERNNYKICINRAQMETLCKLPHGETKGCDEKLGPQHIAQCDKLIDELPKLIEKRDAARKAELSQ